ncbi:MAG: hypothetical protein H0T73_02640 [Ardenticatenales bacterium]|nr:hypothetical protein [Ardenticatenales bacterium]
MLDHLPPAVREALEAGNPHDLQAALSALPQGEAAVIVKELQDAGVIAVQETDPLDMQRVLRQVEPLLRGIVAVARGDEGPRPQIEALLADLEGKGWRLTKPVNRFWAGERDLDELTVGLDDSDSQVMWRIIQILDEPPLEEIGASLPSAVVAAFESGDFNQFQEALNALPEAEREKVVASLETLAQQATTEESEPLEEGEITNFPEVQRQFDPLLREIAEIAKGHSRSRGEIDALLPQLEDKGWQLMMPVHRIWAGERDLIALTAGVDSNSAKLVARILEFIAQPSADDTLDELPQEVRQAFESGDPQRAMASLTSLPPSMQHTVMGQLRSFARQLLQQLPPESQQEMLAQLDHLSAEPAPAQTEQERLLEQFDPLLRGVAAVARGSDAARPQVEAALEQIENGGWHLTAPVQRLWAGERNQAALIEGLDQTDRILMQRILELVEQPSREEIIAGLPAGVRNALEAGDTIALRAALAALPDHEAASVVGRMRNAGIIE